MVRGLLYFFGLLLALPCWAVTDERLAAELDRPAVSDFNTCAKPLWPMEDLRHEHTGTVTFIFLIAIDGHVTDASVTKSSGHISLDEATIEAVKKCRFQPGIKDGKAVPAWMQMQYVWRLD